MADFFQSKPVPWLQNYLNERGISSSGKRKAELLDLCVKSNDMKLRKLDEPAIVEKTIASKLTTEDGKLHLPNPLTEVKTWSHSFSNILEFSFPDLYNYLVDSGGYSRESLKSFKSLLGYKLYYDGHVENLQWHHVPNTDYHMFKFSVKPTERSKLDNRESCYKGFFVLKKDGSVHSGYCLCKGGADGGCRHLAASLFDLLATVVARDIQTCTSKNCSWVRRGKRNERSIPISELEIGRPEYGKRLKSRVPITQCEPGSVHYDVEHLQLQFKRELIDACSNAVVLPYLPELKESLISEEELTNYISKDENVENEETVEGIFVYSLNEYADIYVSAKCIDPEVDEVDEDVALEFLNFVKLDDDQIETIFDQTKSQSQSTFWFEQRAGRITASNFYTVCHMRQKTDRTNIIKSLMNYSPMDVASMPEQLIWGHEKEKAAILNYMKKVSKHKSVQVLPSGLVINKSFPYLGASPDGIRSCNCCPKKTLVEVKSLYSKRSLLPFPAAQEHLNVDSNGEITLKSETRWNYQIQGQMAISEIYDCDLIIYTNKGILIVPVKFDNELWKQALSKLKSFYTTYIVKELVTKEIYHKVFNHQPT